MVMSPVGFSFQGLGLSIIGVGHKPLEYIGIMLDGIIRDHIIGATTNPLEVNRCATFQHRNSSEICGDANVLGTSRDSL